MSTSAVTDQPTMQRDQHNARNGTNGTNQPFRIYLHVDMPWTSTNGMNAQLSHRTQPTSKN